MSVLDSVSLGAMMKGELWNGYARLRLLIHRETEEYHEYSQCQDLCEARKHASQVQVTSTVRLLLRFSVSVFVLVSQVPNAQWPADHWLRTAHRCI